MEVHFAPEIEKRLNELAAQSGRPADELVQDAVAIYARDLAHTRSSLDSRYDDIKSGRVKMTPGEEAFARLMAKIEAERKQRSL
jgi:predicted transcriptional regulator